MDSGSVKALARELGADLVGIASAATLEAFPPDPRWPQTPGRIWPAARSVIVIGKHVPAGAYRLRLGAADRYQNNLVIRRIERIAHALASRLEEAGQCSHAVITNETNWSLKSGTYGYLSTRHVAAEAGLGTIGLNLNLVTPEYGSRVQFAAVLTALELDADHPLTEQVCVGEGCSRCLHCCPPDAVGHFALDKRACSTCAQVYGFAMLTAHVASIIRDPERAALEEIWTPSSLNHWLAMTRVSGCYGACMRCVAVCPVGVDYHEFLAEAQKDIPEKTPEKLAKGKGFRDTRRSAAEVEGLNDWNIRWVGPDGYSGRAAKQRRRAKP